MKFVLDTNILLLYLRDKETKESIESEFNLFGNDNDLIISTVTVGEIRSISKRNKWGDKCLQAVEAIMDRLLW